MVYLDWAATCPYALFTEYDRGIYVNPNANYAYKEKQILKDCEERIKKAIGVKGGHVLYFRVCSDAAKWLASHNWMNVTAHPESHDATFSCCKHDGNGKDVLTFIPYVNHLTGKIYDVQELVHDGSYVAIDATQAIGKLNLSRNAMQYADAILMSGHKIGCPSLSFLHISDAMCKRLHADNGIENQYGLVHGSLSVSSVLALCDAVEEACTGIYVVMNKHQTLLLELLKRLKENGIEYELVYDEMPSISSINLIRLKGINADALQQYCASHECYIGIAASACASGGDDRWRVARAIGLTDEEAEQCVRISFGIGTSVTAIERFVGLVCDYKRKFTQQSENSHE